MEQFEKLEKLVEASKEEAVKFYEKGNASAGTRLRKNLMEIKTMCHEIRKNVVEAKKA